MSPWKEKIKIKLLQQGVFLLKPFNGPSQPLNMVWYSSQSRQRSCRLDVGISNDPSTGSPTETLLQLLLPLNDQV